MSTDPPSGPIEPRPTLDVVADYHSALARYEPETLRRILQNLGASEGVLPARASELASLLVNHLQSHRDLGTLLSSLPRPCRLAVGLFAWTERPLWRMEGMTRALRLMGVEIGDVLADLFRLGFIAVRRDDARMDPVDLEEPQPDRWPASRLIAFPGLLPAARTVVPEVGNGGPLPIRCVRQIREADGLEPILRVAAIWQRVADMPLRQTQHRTLYKRDRERLHSDPAIAGPIADILEPLSDPIDFWLALARAVDLLVDESGSDRIVATQADYWAENAIHLPQMLSLRWLTMAGWDGDAGARSLTPDEHPTPPDLRPAIMLRLAELDDESWFAVEDLANDFSRRVPDWFEPYVPLSSGQASPLGTAQPIEPRTLVDDRKRSRRPREVVAAPGDSGNDRLRAILLGPAYQLGLIRVAEEDPSGRRVVQLTSLGRYVMALGSPAPRPSFEHFLFVQPNFEVIAYRQGLNPSLIGQFSRFARWAQLGAALELSLTPEDLYRGLEGGLTTEAILDRLGRHSERPLPPGVAETLKSWSSRRERVAYHAAATLVEFAAEVDLESALADWPTDPQPIRVAPRLLLVESENDIPFHRFRMLGARDYRRPFEVCVEVEADGVTLTIDPKLSDLLVDAELARLADEQPIRHGETPGSLPRRLFRVTPRSLGRALAEGLTQHTLSIWFRKRAGQELPPAIRLLLRAQTDDARSLGSMRRAVILTVESAELLDGLLQHPATSEFLFERVGPRTAIVQESHIEPIRNALVLLGYDPDAIQRSYV